MTHCEERTFEIPSRKLILKTELLQALSRFFSQGGEHLQETLTPLSQSAANFAANGNLTQLYHAVNCLEEFAQADVAEYEAMKYEFNRLFVGPMAPKAPPYESVYRSPDRLVMQAQTVEVRKMYQRAQLQTAGQGHEPDDFIGTELEFMAYLLFRAMDTREEQNSAQAGSYLDLYEEFCSQHADQWWEEFAQVMSQSAKHPVFMAVSDVLMYLTQSSLQ